MSSFLCLILAYFLGIEVSSTSERFFVFQGKYIQNLLAHAALTDECTVETPMELNVHLRASDGDPCLIRRVIVILLGV